MGLSGSTEIFSPPEAKDPSAGLAHTHSIEARSSFARDLFVLTKPGVLSLLLISTCCPMVLAAKGQPPWWLIFLALLGGALISASASVLNCIWDRDIDAIMERTKNRPLPAKRLSVRLAFVYSLLLGLSGYFILHFGLNPLAAEIALAGHLFYVFVYTMWLKRRTPQNIVIGGAAGAVPPVVGWAGVTGEIGLEAILMFLLIFLWTPPHFWALALNKNMDYQRAQVPMLPVVAGPRSTKLQMFLYALSLLPVSFLLVWSSPELGIISLVVMLSLGIIFSYKTYRLLICDPQEQELHTKNAWDVFKFSLVYLALFFACLVVDAA